MRAGFQTRQFEERLMTIGVPYAVIGGLRFYERAEIRDALAYLRLVVQPNDALAFERIVNLPRRGIGQAALNTFHQAAKEAGISVPKAARMLLDTKLIKGNARSNLILFFQMLDSWQEKLPDFKPSELANLILEESGYLEMWRRDPNIDAQQRLDNLKELIRAIDDFENLQGFLEHVSLVLDNADMASGDRVNMMTLHAAKGLEFNTVFLTGWEEGLFPHIRSLDEEGGLEEERRLAYVGLTRARKHAIITYAGFRRLPQGGKPCTPSQFIAELPKNHCIRIHMNGYVDCSSTETFQTKPTSKGYQQPLRIVSPTPAKPAAQFKVFEKVFHQKFGYGKIIEIDGDTLIIDFETSGQKHIISSFVEKA
jgi:DNA helicase-2/ATP-dependent DNA helicase PcrA